MDRWHQILCLHVKWDVWVTRRREFLATVRCTIAVLGDNICVRGRRDEAGEKVTEGKKNPSEIERQVTQQSQTGLYTESKKRVTKRRGEQERRREFENKA